jgi:hypothetical protein
MTDNTVARQILPNVHKVKSTPFTARDRKVLVYTPELIKAINARNVYKHTPPSVIATELGMDRAQVLRAIALGRKLLVKESWAAYKPELTYMTVRDEPPSAPAQRKYKYKTDFKWPLDLVKWAIAQHDINGHGATAILHALPVTMSPLPTRTAITLWLQRTLKHVMHLKVEAADCQLLPYQVTPCGKWAKKAKPKAKLKPLIEPKLKAKAGRKGGVSMKAKIWALEKALALIDAHNIALDELTGD